MLVGMSVAVVATDVKSEEVWVVCPVDVACDVAVLFMESESETESSVLSAPAIWKTNTLSSPSTAARRSSTGHLDRQASREQHPINGVSKSEQSYHSPPRHS